MSGFRIEPRGSAPLKLRDRVVPLCAKLYEAFRSGDRGTMDGIRKALRGLGIKVEIVDDCVYWSRSPKRKLKRRRRGAL